MNVIIIQYYVSTCLFEKRQFYYVPHPWDSKGIYNVWNNIKYYHINTSTHVPARVHAKAHKLTRRILAGIRETGRRCGRETTMRVARARVGKEEKDRDVRVFIGNWRRLRELTDAGLRETVGNPIKTNGLRKYSLSLSLWRAHAYT